jgi:hypothetical protein
VQKYIEDSVSELIIAERMSGVRKNGGKLRVSLSKTDSGKLEVHFTDHVE